MRERQRQCCDTGTREPHAKECNATTPEVLREIRESLPDIAYPGEPATPPPVVAQSAGGVVSESRKSADAYEDTLTDTYFENTPLYRIAEDGFCKGYLAGHAAATASMREKLGEVRIALESIADGSEGFSYREYTGPQGEGISETNDANKVAREALATLNAILEGK